MVRCNNAIYLKNLVKSLEEAKTRKDIDQVILYSTELEQYKTICGYTPAIKMLENAIEHTANEMGLLHNEQIQRSLQPPTQKVCSKCHAQNPPPQRRSFGFSGMLKSAFPSTEKEKPPEPPQPPHRFLSPFQRMVEASIHGGRQNMSGYYRNRPASKPEPVERSANIPLGFGGQLGAVFGSPEQTSQPVERSVPPVGFRAMLDAPFSPPREGRQATVTSLEDGETILMGVGFCHKGTITRKGGKFITSYIPRL